MRYIAISRTIMYFIVIIIIIIIIIYICILSLLKFYIFNFNSLILRHYFLVTILKLTYEVLFAY